MKDTVSHYVPPHSPLTSTEPQVFSNNLTMPCQRRLTVSLFKFFVWFKDSHAEDATRVVPKML
jgi:hypothetical protein